MKKLLSFLLILITMVVMNSCTNFSDGERVGIITKFSNSGRLCKSYEGELKIAPNVANQGMIGQYETFHFSLDRDKTIECITPIDSIKEYAKTGVAVVVQYQQTAYLNWFNNRGDTQYFIKSIKRVK